MPRTIFIALALSVVVITCTGGIAPAGILGPGPWFGRTWAYGNDTGGIIPYSPWIRNVTVYRQMAADYCARWRRLSHVTSVHRKYGDYVSFVCIDRPGVIH